MRQRSLAEALQGVVDGFPHRPHLVGKPGPQHRGQVTPVPLTDSLQQHELDVALDRLQAGPDPSRLTSILPLLEPAQQPFHPQLLDPFPTLGRVVEQRNAVAIVLQTQPPVMDAPIHFASDLVGGQMLQRAIVRQFVPLPNRAAISGGNASAAASLEYTGNALILNFSPLAVRTGTCYNLKQSQIEVKHDN